MARYQVTKSVDARKLHPRSGIPLSEPPVMLPFGAILENLREDRDLFKFSYLGQPYQCEKKALKPAIQHLDGVSSSPAETPAESIAAFDESPSPEEKPAAEPDIRWHALRTTHSTVLRTKIPGGWLVMPHGGAGLVFVPDAQHVWDGKSLD